ncbi:MAG: hypothetical protein R3344_05070 [Acidobacteriota bacterium]|nr:hypothetical protein [Acidobacteriota bacterium]
MARRRNRNAEVEEPEGGILQERGRRMAAGLLLVSVVAILLFAAVQRTDEPFGDPAAGVAALDMETGDALDPAESPEPSGSPPPQEAMPETAVSGDEPSGDASGVGTLAARVMEDRERISRGGGGFTVQLMVACSPETVHRIVSLSGQSADLYVLPTIYQGRSCYRLCWGSYDTREAADQAAPPDAVRQEVGKTFVASIPELQP